MIHLHFEIEICGGVRRVGNTRVVTRFRTVNMVPYWPIESAYEFPYKEASFATTVDGHAPEAFGQTLMPLARLDVLSVVTAYLRGLCGLLLVIGCMAIFPLVMRWTGERLDEFAQALERVLYVCLAVGITGGCCSYWLCPQTLPRERRIRECCRQAFGIALDPASLESGYESLISREHARWRDACANAPDSRDWDAVRREAAIARLVECRVQILCGGPLGELEAETDASLSDLETL